MDRQTYSLEYIAPLLVLANNYEENIQISGVPNNLAYMGSLCWWNCSVTFKRSNVDVIEHDVIPKNGHTAQCVRDSASLKDLVQRYGIVSAT